MNVLRTLRVRFFAWPHPESVEYIDSMVEIIARVPDDHHPWQSVYLAADRPEFGRWRADGSRFEWRHGSHHLFLDLPDGTPLKFLLTRGHWRNAEATADGREPLPHELTAQSGLRYEVSVAGWGRNSVRYHHDFASQFLSHSRTLSVWLPPGYDHDSDRRYPVLYLHDGQNLFDAHTAFAGVPWRCDETAEVLVRNGHCRPVILVGVANTQDRLREYGPQPESDDDLSWAYGSFLTREVKPFIDAEYRILPGPGNAGVGGASMGGLISLVLCERYPEHFGLCAAMSPSLWWDDERLVRDTAAGDSRLSACRVWIDVGGREGHSEVGMAANARRTRRMAELLSEHTSGGVTFTEDPDAGHNEAAWAHRFGDVLKYLFPPG